MLTLLLTFDITVEKMENLLEKMIRDTTISKFTNLHLAAKRAHGES